MAITKELKDDYEVRTEHKHINVRTKTSIMEDGKELSFSIWTDAVKKAWSDKLEADKKALENKVGE